MKQISSCSLAEGLRQVVLERGEQGWAALSSAGMSQEWTPFDNSQVSVVFCVTLSTGTCCSQRKMYFPAMKNFCGANAFCAHPMH